MTAIATENVHEKFYRRWLKNWTAPSSVVRRKCSTATAHNWADRWTIYANTVPQEVLGEGKTALLAWRDAERKMMSNGGVEGAARLCAQLPSNEMLGAVRPGKE